MSSKQSAFVQEQTNAFYPDGIQYHYWQIARTKIIINKLLAHNLQNFRMLEIGCGRGQVVEALATKDMDILGVELATVTPFQSVTDKIYTGRSFAALPKHQKEQITLGLLLDVIEHIEDPMQFIKEIYEEYPNMSYIFLTVPAMNKLWSNYDEYINHYKRYEISDLAAIAKLTDSTVLDYGYFFHSLYPMARLLLKLKNKRNLSIKAPTRFTRPLHSMIGQFLYLDYKFCPASTVGSSLFFILKRNSLNKH